MNTQKKETEVIFCNQCKKEIKTDQGIIREGAAPVEIEWGYFSNKDGEVHSFCLCEACYDKLVQGFGIPVTVREKSELV